MRRAGLVVATALGCLHAAHGAPAAPPPAQAELPPLVSFGDVLASLASLRGVALFADPSNDKVDAMIISAEPESGSGASCRAVLPPKRPAGALPADVQIRCVAFAGYDEQHLVDALADHRRAEVAAPTWARTLATVSENAADPNRAVLWIETDATSPVGPVLSIDVGLDGVHYAIKRGGRWIASSQGFEGGKITRPFYFGAIDLAAAAKGPELGLVLGGYEKEHCVIDEWTELVAFDVTDTALVERGHGVIGWSVSFLMPEHRAPFDPKDPDRYSLVLAPRVQHDGSLRLDIDTDHRPPALRKRAPAIDTSCGPTDATADFADVDAIAKLAGRHTLDALVAGHDGDIGPSG